MSHLWRSWPCPSVPAGSRVQQSSTVKLFTQPSLCLLTLLKQNSHDIEFNHFDPPIKLQHHLTLKSWFVVIFPTEGIPQPWIYGRCDHSWSIMTASNHACVTTLSIKLTPAGISLILARRQYNRLFYLVALWVSVTFRMCRSFYRHCIIWAKLKLSCVYEIKQGRL